MFNKSRTKYLLKPAILAAVFTAGIFFISQNIFGQENLKVITASFAQFHENNIQEKIFVHTDKNFYLTGEIIWFKLYNIDASFHKPLNLSKVAYVEILDTLNNPVLQAKIELDSGKGNGSFYLPQAISSGNYKLRAYTNWMKNFDPAYFFQKKITVINFQKIPAYRVDDSIQKYDVQFFPEGGDLVNGLQSKVAFKAITQKGNSFNFNGYLLDEGDTLLQFKPHHAGMGNFVFTPAKNHIYKAIIAPVIGNTFTKELPLVYETGYNMTATEAGNNKINVSVQTNIASIKQVYLFAHTRESVKVAAAADLQNGKAVFVFDRSLLGDGISQITVFNDQKKPVCERLYFKMPAETLQLSLNTDQPVYTTRSKVNIDISSENIFPKNDASCLSLAVYRLDSLQSIDDHTIETYLLLSSDLGGYIENPSYYFTATEKDAAIALDDLMLTNGWRRFKWNDVLQNQKPFFEFVPEFNGHIITGKVTDTKTGMAQKGIETFLSVPGSMTQFRTSRSDANGRVKFEMQNFFAGNSIVVQPNTLTDSTNKIDIDDPFSKRFSDVPIPSFHRPVNYPNTLSDQSISMQVQNIYTADKLKVFSFPPIDSSAFYLHPDYKYLLDDYTRFTSLEEVLREYVVLVNVSRRNGRVYLPVVDVASNQLFQSDPLVLLDAVPVFNFNKLLEFDPLKLKSLEVVNRRYFFGNSVFDGILNMKTYSANLSNYEFSPNTLVMDYEGLQLEREFYAPSYDNDAALSSHLPDFRNVLQWLPDINLKHDEKKSIHFYTSDLPGNYAAVVQGISSGGLCGSKIIIFDVKK
ncbi:MAG: hypothetical protein ABI861_12580 [Panacibacter sp.]